MFDILNIQRTTFTVANFLSWSKGGELELSPSFQRRPVWPKKAKSYFIDTVSRGLPIPIVFLRENTDIDTLKTVREVVDGQQRLRTLLSFIDAKSLSDYNPEHDDFMVSRSHNIELSGRSFAEFSDRVRKSILSYQIPVHVLPPDTSDDQVLDIFRRMNATGTKLNWQELRNARYFGPFIESVYSISYSNLHRWRKWGLLSEQQIARMDEAEFVSELYIYLLKGLSAKSQRAIDKVYEEYDDAFPERENVEFATSHTLSIIDDAFGLKIAGSRIANKAIFFAVFCASVDKLFNGTPLTSAPRTDLRQVFERGMRRLSANLEADDLPEQVKLALASRSNSLESRNILHNYVNQTIFT